MKTNNTVVYRHIKPCGEVFYVGIGTPKRPYNRRPRNQFWANVVKKYPDYKVDVVAAGLSWEMACELEELMILEYGRRDLGTGTLVNMTAGGEGTKGFVHSEETRRKISIASLNMSEETRQKLSAAKKGKKSPNYGKKHSKETRQKISAAHKGKKLSEEHLKKLSALNSSGNHPFYGKKHSKETLQKMSASQMGKKFSKEHRQKISAALSGENNPMHGAPAPNRKLTFELAQEIRHRYKTEKTSTYKLGAEYGVSGVTISRIIQNKTYTQPE